jgi:hypothetical protein
VERNRKTRRGEEKTDRRDILSTNFSSRSFDTPLAIIPTHSKAFENLLNLTIFDYLHNHYRSTAWPIIGLRDGSLNRPECPLTCARSSSTIALSSSISSFSSIFSPCSFAFSSLSLENSVPEDVLGVFSFGDVLLGINLSFASTVWICRRDVLA